LNLLLSIGYMCYLLLKVEDNFRRRKSQPKKIKGIFFFIIVLKTILPLSSISYWYTQLTLKWQPPVKITGSLAQLTSIRQD